MLIRKQRRQYIFRCLSGALLIILAMIIVVFFLSYASQQRVIKGAQQFQAKIDEELFISTSEDDLPLIADIAIKDGLARPLLLSTRRPVTAESTIKPVEPLPEKPKDIPPLDGQLTSVIITGQTKMIFFAGAEGTIRLNVGMRYNDWQLTGISEDSATFTFDGQERILTLRHFANAPPTTVQQLGGKAHSKNKEKDKEEDKEEDEKEYKETL